MRRSGFTTCASRISTECIGSGFIQFTAQIPGWMGASVLGMSFTVPRVTHFSLTSVYNASAISLARGFTASVLHGQAMNMMRTKFFPLRIMIIPSADTNA
jgi:hypothetical protein